MSGPKRAHFPVGCHLPVWCPLPGGQGLRQHPKLVVFPLSCIPVLIKVGGGGGCVAYCISVKVMTLIGISGGKVQGIEDEKASCEQSPSARERREPLSRCQPFHPTEDGRLMSFHSQVRAGSGV